MTIRTYIHSSHKRVESSALLDCGATENFMSMDYAKWLHLPIKRLQAPCPLFNVDGTTNRKGDLLFYSDLKMKTGSVTKIMRFFLTDLGHHRIILGYPWFVANQPRIDWAKGWIDVSPTYHHLLPRISHYSTSVEACNAHATTNSFPRRTPPGGPSRLPHEKTNPHTSRVEHDSTTLSTTRTSLFRRSSATLPRTMHLGSRHQPETWSPYHSSRKNLLPYGPRTRRTKEVRHQTHSERLHPPVQKSLCRAFLLYQEKRRET